MDEEEEICRVCRGEGTLEEPLFHPCKCSGSIRFVHQQCLTDWLAHSKKKYCELCNHYFSFTPVYKEDMPAKIPKRLFLLHLKKVSAGWALWALRLTLVCSMWLGLVPYLTVWIWRFYFWNAETTYNVFRRVISYNKKVTNTTGTANNDLDDISPSLSKSILYDCLEGWLITFSVMVIFIAGFLLREWIVQNVPHGMQEDNVNIDREANDVADDTIIPHEDEHQQEQQPLSLPAAIINSLAETQQQQEIDADDSHSSEQQYTRRERRGKDRQRPIFQQEPSDYENIQAMWADNVVDESSRRNTNNSTIYRPNRTNTEYSPQRQPERHLLDMDPQFEDDEEVNFDDDDDGFFNNHDGGNAITPFRPDSMDDIIKRIRRESQASAAAALAVSMSTSDSDTIQQHQHASRFFIDNEHDNAGIPTDLQNQDQQLNPPAELVVVDNNNHNREVEIEGAAPAGAAPDGPEDIIGILEAIGMRGSLYILFQNSCLMLLLMGVCLGVGVWLPYILGVLFITVRPWTAFHLLSTKLYSFAYLFMDHLYKHWTTVFSRVQPIEQQFPDWTPVIVRAIAITATQIGNNLFKFFTTYEADDYKAYLSSNVTATAPDILLVDPSSIHTQRPSLWDDLITVWRFVSPSFKTFSEDYVRMPASNNGFDRMGCIVTGYLILCVFGSFYLSQSGGAYAQISRTARTVIEQLGIFLKVSFFMMIEITVFPLCCGVMLDCVSLSLFYTIDSRTGAAGHLLAIHRRMTFLKENLTSSIFMHWVVGTGFMFIFTNMVTFCREVVRPGVLWFIRDPNDPQFNPIKELVERPVWTQLKKIGASAVLYGFIIEIGVGGLVATIDASFEDILPLKWSYTQPLIILPFDLLIVMIIIPAMIGYFNPKKLIESIMIRWTTWLCHQLRLTSFLLGDRPVEEEGYIHYKSWKAWLVQQPKLRFNDATGAYEETDEAVFIHTGQLVRAPKHDGVRFVPGRRMLVPVDPVTFEALNPIERELGHPAANSREEEEANTTIIYLPPYFNIRIAAFMAVMWVSWSALLCYFFVGPIAIGRWLFGYFGIVAQPGRKIHDVYAYFFGVNVIILVGYLVKKLKHFVLSDDIVGVNSLVNGLRWLFNLCVISLLLGVILPGLFGLILHLYIVIPLQNWNDQIPRLNVFLVWTNGIACLALLHGLLTLAPVNRLSTAINRFRSNGIKNFDLKTETKELFAPIVLVCLIAIFLPYCILIIRNKCSERDERSRVKFLQTIYPAMLIGIVTYYACYGLTKLVRKWRQTVREDHYLTGRVLHNLDS